MRLSQPVAHAHINRHNPCQYQTWWLGVPYYTQWAPKVLGHLTNLLLFWLCTPAIWIWNDRLKCILLAFIWGYFHPYWVNCLEIKWHFVHSPLILGDQMYWDKLTFGPIFIACNENIKLVTLQICWMHLLFVFCCVSDYFVPNIN
jgi:hypothetical protein